MGFLRPKAPAIPPLPAPPPPPPVLIEDLPDEKEEKIKKKMEAKKKGMTETILTSRQGDTSTPEIYKKTLLGG